MAPNNNDVYYDGDLGDLGNVDWFFERNHHQLMDVTSVFVVMNGRDRSLRIEITYRGGVINGTIVRNPKQGTASKFTQADVGMQVWVDTDPAILRKPGILLSIQKVTVVVALDGGGTVQCSEAAVHRLQTGTPKNEGYIVIESNLGTKKRTETERMNDFFRGKDTW